MNNRYLQNKYSWMKHYDFIMLDSLAILFAFTCVYILKFRNIGFLFSVEWRQILFVELILNLMIIFFSAPFSGILRRYGTEEFLSTALQTLYNLFFCSILLYALKIGANYSRTVILGGYGMYFILSLTFRMIRKKEIRAQLANAQGDLKRRIFVIGNRVSMPQMLRSIHSEFFGAYTIQGVCLTEGQVGEHITADLDVLDEHDNVKRISITYDNVADLDGFVQYILDHDIDEVFVGTDPTMVSPANYQVLFDNGILVHLDIQTMVGITTNNQFISTVGTYKALSLDGFSFNGQQVMYFMVKRAFDVVFGVVGVVAMLPLMALVKLFNLVTGDCKPIFYTQTRIGLNGKPFKMYKFRSMVHNADEILRELLEEESYRKEWEENQKFEHDPRITKMGNFLRKTSLDEIPQFINVLKGDMSLIGPRPLVPGELQMHNGLQLYNLVKPGITGWWGCNGRSNTTYDERLELEYYYVKNCSLYLDVLCILKTIVVILKQDGAK